MSKKDTSLLFLQSSSFKNESMVQGVQAVGVNMRVLRLPAIHHDANLVVVEGSAGNLLIDAGTSWYQSLQVERMKGVLGDENRLIESSFRASGTLARVGQSTFRSMFGNCPVHIHPKKDKQPLKLVIFSPHGQIDIDSDMPAFTN